MKRYQMYTNTGNPGAIVGLILVTFVTTAVVLYTPQICEGIVNLVKTGKNKATDVLHKGKKEYYVCAMTTGGKMYDTGERVWRK